MDGSDDDVRKSTGKTRSGRARANPRAPGSQRRKKEEAEIQRVKAAVAKIPVCAQTPLFRVNRRQRKQQKAAAESDAAKNPDCVLLRCTRFAQLPLSEATRDALAASKFDTLTPVQQSAIPQGLAGRDLLVAAPTGSGKTLAFLVPLLEALWVRKWSVEDRLGAIVLAPTRELALQIFQVLRKVAHYHTLSAGLIIGGKEFESERDRVGFMNILVATPGRLLHHLDTASDMDCTALKMLVLDEADRILDMGFEKTVDAILEHLPTERQTLLFSATQTKSLKALARLSLRSPQYISVMARTEEERVEMQEKNEDAETTGDSQIVGIPQRILQSYSVVPSHDKLGVLWSFLKSHLKAKIIVFFATGKQVRFAFDSFCKMRPGMSLLHIHGNMKQLRRMEVFEAFTRTANAALFATDIASRGLDFPNVDWVVQVDCPDDVATYIHRVGRTARFRSNGKGMLFLGDGKEQVFLERLAEKGIALNKVRINPERVAQVTPILSAVVASNKELKSLGQRAFTFYLKSIFQQSDKSVFDVLEHNIELLSKSFGLAVTPRVTFRTPSSSVQAKDKDGKTVFGYRPRPERPEKKVLKPTVKTSAEVESKPLDGSDSGSGANDNDGNILTLKRVHDPEEQSGVEDDSVEDSVPRKRKRMKLDHVNRMASVNRIVYDDDGNPLRASEVVDDSDESSAESERHDDVDSYALKVANRLSVTQEDDKERERIRVREKHAKRKAKLRMRNKASKPNADIQQRMLEQLQDSEGEEESNIDEEQDLALAILEARNQ